MLVFVVIHAVVEFNLIGRYILLFGLTYGTAFIVGSRMLVWKLAEQQRRNVLVYGSPEAFSILERELEKTKLPILLVGHAQLELLLPGDAAKNCRVQKLGLYAHCEETGAEEIVIEEPDALTGVEREALLFCISMGISVVDLGYFYEREFERVYVQGLKESWFWGYDPTYVNPVYFAAKRTLDTAISLVGLLAFAPLAPLVILIIKLQDRGPVIYSQVRVGLNNQTFRIYKFRTMRTDAETGGAQWANKEDDRVTWFGRFMRLSRIDEVPQFWNILKGEMSFIGPRPERPELVGVIEQEVPYYRYRHLIKPGLTGWAQVNYPYGASIEDARQKLSYDLYYLKYGSATREMHIALRTIVAMVKGAR
jgi:exopolysaccharide biosynthesis polyprenyl glycosylphosphotransferase